MQFTPDETKKLEAMILFLVKKTYNESGGHCGFNVQDLQPIVDNLEAKGEIKARRTIHSNRYFLNK